MSIQEFLEELQGILQREEALSGDEELKDLEEWDSIAIMTCVVWFESRLGIRQPYQFFQAQKTVRDLIRAGEGKIA
ncbi:MAG: hypothetical protein J1E80_09620 [Desulfovibrionaceae bacterium]|nr:hypothetical protein [Desulfovibrionaceae bacterium]